MKINPLLALVIGIILGISVAYVGIAVGFPNNGQVEEKVDQLREQLMTKGVTFSAVVGKIYPGVGFIATDSSNEIFVEWDGIVKEKQNVNVNGTLSTDFSKMKSKEGFTLELESYFMERKFFISAKNVSQI